MKVIYKIVRKDNMPFGDETKYIELITDGWILEQHDSKINMVANGIYGKNNKRISLSAYNTLIHILDGDWVVKERIVKKGVDNGRK